MINGNNSYWQNSAMNIRKDEDEWRLAKDTVPAPSELGTKEITENGNYSAKDDGLDGYSDVNVTVSNSYTAEDEGKVVDNGALVAQTAMAEEVTENGTINTTLYNSVTVNVSGGGGVSSGDDVKFYDYDGSVVASYSAADFATLTAMPENPTHTGLTGQGWNWTLADAKAYVAANGKLNIGQMYITSDGKTRLYYIIPKDNLTLSLYLDLDTNTELDIDWGDNSEHTTWTYGDGDSSKSHTYSDGGRYTVAITVVSGEFSCQSSQSEDYTLKKVELGIGVTSIRDNAFYYYSALSSITIPNSVTSIGSDAFSYCSGLTSITIPNGITSINYSTFTECYALSSVAIPNSVTSIEYNIFYNCYALSSVTIPNSVTSIGSYAFYNCYALTSITIPNGVTSIEYNTFYECCALTSITIPNGVTNIAGGAFESCGLSSITFESSTPPELSGDLGIPTTCIIRVPQGSLSDYTSAENYPDPEYYIYEEY